MLNFLDKIRNKENGEKKAFALLFAGVVSGLIFVAWLLSVIATWESDMSIKNSFNGNSDVVNTVKFEKLPGQVDQEYTEDAVIGDGVPIKIIWSSTTEN